MAYVLMARDHCTPSSCAVFRSLSDNHQVVSNMDERVYANLITRYAPSWNAPPIAAAGQDGRGTAGVDANRQARRCGLSSAASTPPVNIMTPERRHQAIAAYRGDTTTAPVPRRDLRRSPRWRPRKSPPARNARRRRCGCPGSRATSILHCAGGIG